MKKIVILLCCAAALLSCKNDKENKSEEPKDVVAEKVISIQAEFIYIADAAVLKGQSFIYGVQLDDKTKELAKKVEPFKKDQYDMVPVVIKGVIKDNPEKEGWKQVVEIREIVDVLPINEGVANEPVKVSVNQ